MDGIPFASLEFCTIQARITITHMRVGYFNRASELRGGMGVRVFLVREHWGTSPVNHPFWFPRGLQEVHSLPFLRAGKLIYDRR